jgi:hypothetical protein
LRSNTATFRAWLGTTDRPSPRSLLNGHNCFSTTLGNGQVEQFAGSNAEFFGRSGVVSDIADDRGDDTLSRQGSFFWSGMVMMMM